MTRRWRPTPKAVEEALLVYKGINRRRRDARLTLNYLDRLCFVSMREALEVAAKVDGVEPRKILRG